MTHEDQVLALFRMANPVPDDAAFAAAMSSPVPLMALEHWSEPMQDTTKHSIEPERPSRNTWMLAAAAVIVAVVAVGSFVLIQDGDDAASPPTTTTPTTTITPVADVGQQATDAVMSTYAAQAAGDLVAFLDALAGEEKEAVTAWQNQFEADAVAHQQLAFPSGCSYEGQNGDGFHVVRCFSTYTHDFYAAAGIVSEGVSTFQLDDDFRVVAWGDFWPDEGPRGADQDFERRFFSWFQTEHPTEFVALTASASDWWYRTPEDMQLVLEYVDEFVASQDDYPVTP